MNSSIMLAVAALACVLIGAGLSYMERSGWGWFLVLAAVFAFSTSEASRPVAPSSNTAEADRGES